jgi:uncharacterized protein (DUF58 family)
VEFADFRPYVHGDDLRFVDWNIFGRLDRLFLKMFLEEEDLSLIIALDTSASMRSGSPDTFDYARRVAEKAAELEAAGATAASVQLEEELTAALREQHLA